MRFSDFKKLEKYLNDFGDTVVKESKEKLSSSKNSIGKSRGNTRLGSSIKVKVTQDSNGFSVKFYMLDYGTFLDKGVSGNEVSRKYTNYKLVNESSPYSYTSKGPPIDILSKWIKKRGIKPKGTGRGRSKKTGQFISGLAYLISKKIKKRGIPSISFFSKPFGMQYSNLGEDFLKEFTKDITSYITTFTKHK